MKKLRSWLWDVFPSILIIIAALAIAASIYFYFNPQPETTVCQTVNVSAGSTTFSCKEVH